MSRRRSPDMSLIQGAIVQQQKQNEEANKALGAQMEEARQRTFGPIIGPPILPGPPTAPLDEFTLQRLELAASKWGSEVVTAAVLDDTFKSEVGQRAHQLLVDHKLVPADEPQQPLPGPATPHEGG